MDRAEEDVPARTRRSSVIRLGAVVLVAVGLVAVALVFALSPFGASVDLGIPDAASLQSPLVVHGQCDAAISTAWNHNSKDHLALRAVTVGTNMMGYTPVFGSKVKYARIGSLELPGAFCKGEARHRLIVSGWLVAGALVAVGTGVCLLFRRRPSISGVL